MYKILVIEDEDNIREALVDVLTLESYHVESACNGLEGYKKAIDILPDLIISDVMMPEMNGYEVINKLKQHPLTFGIPFLFLTARYEKEDRRFGMELGADDYITKPFQGEEILRAVKTRINKYTDIKRHHEKELEELRQNITSSLPHEMRTPLTVMLGFAQLLKSSRKLGSDEIESMAQSICEAGDRLLKLISNYTHFTELLLLEKNHIQPDHKRATIPSRIIYDLSGAISYKYNREDDIELILDNQPVDMPENYFSKLMEELLDNAFKFSEPNTKVKIVSGISDKYYSISIKNQGRALSKEQIAKIGAFMQFDRKEYEQQGTGLGLAIVKKTIELFNGHFEIAAIPENKTEVTVQIPLHK